MTSRIDNKKLADLGLKITTKAVYPILMETVCECGGRLELVGDNPKFKQPTYTYQCSVCGKTYETDQYIRLNEIVFITRNGDKLRSRNFANCSIRNSVKGENYEPKEK